MQYLKVRYKKKKYRNFDYFYIIHCTNSSFYKIGITTSGPNCRLHNLQVGCPYKLEMIEYFKTVEPKRLETKFKYYFKKYKTHGKWFSFNSNQLNIAILWITNNIIPYT